MPVVQKLTVICCVKDRNIAFSKGHIACYLCAQFGLYIGVPRRGLHGTSNAIKYLRGAHFYMGFQFLQGL